MSNVYSIEPPTRGKVIVTTTLGAIDIELWPKEAPLAVRNFCQLCMENYFDGVIFHRVIPKFMAQTGDPTGTGAGGESIYGENFKDEVHSRLKFSHRGIVAMASSGRDTNGSQFFFALGECRWLDNKHTIFGKVTGDSIYNMDALGEVDVGEDDRPTHPPKIISTEVISCPFDDIFPRVKEEVVVEEKKPKKKMSRQTKLLSFGDEAETEDKEVAAIPKMRIKSSHDALNDPTLSTEVAVEISSEKNPDGTDESAVEATRRKLKNSKSKSKRDVDAEPTEIDLKKKAEEVEKTLQKARASSIAAERLAEREAREREALNLRKEIAKLNASMGSRSQRNGYGEDSVQQLLTPIEQRRQSYKSKSQLIRGRESMTLAKLAEFQTKQKKKTETEAQEEEEASKKRVREEKEEGEKVSAEPSDADDPTQKVEYGALTAPLEDYDDSGWQKSTISFPKEKKIPNPYEHNFDDDYSVFDPRKQDKKKARNDHSGKVWEKGSMLL